MRIPRLACAALVAFACTSAVHGQTYEELKKENEQLRAQLKALRAAQKPDSVVVSYEPATGKLVVADGDRQRTVVLKPRTHVHDAEGYEVPAAQRADKLKAGVRVEIVEEDGQLHEINIRDGRGGTHRHDHKHADEHKHGHEEHYDYFRRAHSHGRGLGLLRRGHEAEADHHHEPGPVGDGHRHMETGPHAPDAHAHGAHAHGSEGHGKVITGFWDRKSWHRDNGHGHRNGHGNGEEHNGHGSVEGYPFMHFNRIEPAYLDRALETTFAWAKHTDGGLFNEAELEFEFLWALNNRFEFVLAGPIRWLNATGRPEVSIGDGGVRDVSFPRSAAGVGDLEVALNFLAFDGERMKLKFGLATGLPTGDEGRGLGAGHVALEPAMFTLLDFGGGTILQSEAALELPLGVADVENEFRYGLGLGHTFVGTQHWRHFRWLTPMVEGVGLTTLNGPDSGHTVFDLTPGLRWMMRRHDEAGFGVSFPITGPRDYEYQVIFRYLLHF